MPLTFQTKTWKFEFAAGETTYTRSWYGDFFKTPQLVENRGDALPDGSSLVYNPSSFTLAVPDPLEEALDVRLLFRAYNYIDLNKITLNMETPDPKNGGGDPDLIPGGNQDVSTEMPVFGYVDSGGTVVLSPAVEVPQGTWLYVVTVIQRTDSGSLASLRQTGSVSTDTDPSVLGSFPAEIISGATSADVVPPDISLVFDSGELQISVTNNETERSFYTGSVRLVG